jgi:hypothetical protein
MIARLLERLAEMFPKQNYQSRLDQYLKEKNVQNEAEVNYWITRYTQGGNGL